MNNLQAALRGQGLDSDQYIDHAHPQAALSSLIPARLGFDIELDRIQPPGSGENSRPTDTGGLSSAQLEDLLRARGVQLEDLPMRLYRTATMLGKNRQLSNEDCLKGKEPLYADLAHFKGIYEQLEQKVVTPMLDYYGHREDQSVLARMEMEDCDKITIQAWKPTGWFLQSPICEQEVPDVYHNQEARAVVRRILTEVYAPKMNELKGKGFKDLVMLDDDPPDTMTGAPFFGSGAQTHQTRWLTLAMCPDPTAMHPTEWVERLMGVGQSMGYPGATFFSPVLSTRYGPLKKPVALWTQVPGGFAAQWQAVGMYNRIRFVFPAPYAINFCLSPLYVQMSHVRKHTLGLWHDPESQHKYISRLQAQGKHTWSIDFSGMDTAMWKPVVLMILEEMERAGLFAWSCNMFKQLYPEMGITLPSYSGQPDMVTQYKSLKSPWCSGFKLTSEMDSLYGLAVLFSCLERQRSGILDDWIAGRFVVCSLGDDICFTTDFDIDQDQLASDALQLWGAKLKIINDAMFLKWCLPIHPEIPRLSRTFSRVVQQTFFNEDRYSGVEGGTRPDALMRLALAARLRGLNAHPDFKKWWPALHGVISQLKYLETADRAFLEGLKSAAPELSQDDVREILVYAQKMPSYFSAVAERAKYEPSAAALIRYLQELGLSSVLPPSSESVRSWLWQALTSRPTALQEEEAIKMAANYVM